MSRSLPLRKWEVIPSTYTMVKSISNGWQISHNYLNSVSYSRERRPSLELLMTYKTDKNHTSRFLIQFYSVRNEPNSTLHSPSYHGLCRVLHSHTQHTILTFFSKTPQFTHWDLHSSGILRSIQLQLLTDVSRQPICPIFKGQEIRRHTLRNVPHERRTHLHRGG